MVDIYISAHIYIYINRERERELLVFIIQSKRVGNPFVM